MRRRRNASASADEVAADEVSPNDTELTAPTQTDAAPPPDTESAAETAEAEPAARPRRRASTPRRRSAQTADAAAAETDTTAEAPAEAPAPEPVPAAESAAEPAPESPAPPARTRRAPARRSKAAIAAEAAAAAEEATPAVEAETAVPEPIVAEVAVDVIEEAETLPETVEATPETAPEPASGGERTGRRRGRGRGRGGANGGGTGDSSAANTTPTSAESSGAPKRTRGLRRTSATEKTAPATIAVPVIDTIAAADAEKPAALKRVRGLRRAAPASVAVAATAATGGAVSATAPVDVLPPPYKPLPDEVLARLPEAKIVVHNRVPELIVNGEARLPLWFFVNTEDTGEDVSAAREIAQREIRYAYEAGIRTFTVLAHLPWRTRSGDRRYDPLDEILQFVLDNAPEALILPRLIFSPPMSWERTHPNEMTAYVDGEAGDISLASRAFWEGEADEALRAAVEHIAQGPHAGHVFGFYLEHGEWLYEKGRGYDISEASQIGFRAWLRTRYKSSIVTLRAAWNDSEVTFDTAQVPLQPVPLGATLFFTAREQRYADFHEYSSDIVAQVITRLGKAIKEASGGRSAVAVSYGYTLEMPRATSGHLALAQVLASPYVDILTGPVSYSSRTPGGSASFPAPVQSVVLAGKLWISEDDTKTFLAGGETPDPYNPKVPSYEGTAAVYARNFGAALASGAGVSWMDLWGTGWLDDRELWQRIGRLRAFAQIAAERRHAPDASGLPDPDVAVIIDERSYGDVRADEGLLGTLISQQRDALTRSGARVGYYLLSDLLRDNFPVTPKLMLFLNPFRIPEAVRTAIKDRFQRDGRTLAFLFGPGCRETSPAELSETVGMQLRLQPWGSKMGTQVLNNARSPLTERLRGQRIGEDVRVNPSCYVADTRAQVLGEYAATGNASIAVRKHARWQSVFIGEMELSLPLLRGLYRLAGVPVYTVDDDAAWIGDGLICLHSAPGGGTTVFLPEEGALYDVLADETLASSGWGARLPMPPRGTRLLAYGKAEAIVALGGNPAEAPEGLLRSELPPPPTAFVFENGGASEAADTASAEDIALMKAAFAAVGSPVDRIVESDEADEVAPAAADAGDATAEDAAGGDAGARKKRRRRRRRRSGEGGAADDAEGGAEPSDEEEGDDEGESAVAGLPEAEETPETLDDAPEATGEAIRVRPSLAELLPDSDFTDGADLPPIPDEFLPLDPTTLTPPAEAESDTDPAERQPPARRPRRRSGTRRTADAAASLPLTDDAAAETEALAEAAIEVSPEAPAEAPAEPTLETEPTA